MTEIVLWAVLALFVLREVIRAVFAYLGLYHSRAPEGDTATFQVSETLASTRLELLRLRGELETARLPAGARDPGRSGTEGSPEGGLVGFPGRVGEMTRRLTAIAENGRRFSGVRGAFTRGSLAQLAVDIVIIAVAVWIASS
ncbi:hypothetical protein ACQEU5_02510 [Marinactinospora thermotolerans]|uniref:Uncharacterized protein n=1 Tax=Marinactinospora thermotolerans DSM 45154 TaxID=1122192 RepID=A0A1T4LSJ7_9ACTN|nr:hypothetical protein [Marinactinospora thermotolerans]SJZ57683.1 hypothetical protein SAMN02745673_00805 [Marinactinospora thermotolerans DSM 45154]